MTPANKTGSSGSKEEDFSNEVESAPQPAETIASSHIAKELPMKAGRAVVFVSFAAISATLVPLSGHTHEKRKPAAGDNAREVLIELRHTRCASTAERALVKKIVPGCRSIENLGAWCDGTYRVLLEDGASASEAAKQASLDPLVEHAEPNYSCYLADTI